jgi:hypothetical protein
MRKMALEHEMSATKRFADETEATALAKQTASSVEWSAQSSPEFRGVTPLSSSRLMDFHEVRLGYGGATVGREFASPDPDTKHKCYTH